MKKTIYLILYVVSLLTISCQQTPVIPTSFQELAEQAVIYPDYRDVTIPANIAPLNFIVKDSIAQDFVAELKGDKGGSLIAGSTDGTIQLDTTAWRSLLSGNRGSLIIVNIYAEHPEGWVKYKAHTLTVAEEEIDPYLSYRLIEPGYELYRQLGLYQRNLTNWDVKVIYENNRTFSDEDNHCVNCHNYQNYSTDRMLFHVRANHGGTIIIDKDKAEKIIIKDSTILTSGVYPSWHPKHNWVAFSTNKTGQTFHIYSEERIEVIDEGSDLLFYDADKGEVSHILRTRNAMETFPCWSPDGTKLYYCSAGTEAIDSIPDSLPKQAIDSIASLWYISHWDSLLYDLKCMTFNEKTRQFGEPEMVVDAASQHKSISVPRVSPDGRYILYTQGDYGQFHIWHKSSDLWVKDLENDTCYALQEANSPDVDSYHTWSSNGRWIVFSSRRMDGNYTRPHIAYFDKQGRAHKAFCLPQEDPMHNVLLLKSYNVPELTKNAVQVSEETLKQCIYQTEGKAVRKR